jgi:hypothetical protein
VNFIERVMRVMTHINVGATLALMAWFLWSGWPMFNGQVASPGRSADIEALLVMANASPAERLELVPMSSDGTALPPCRRPHAAPNRAEQELSGADL